MFAKLRFLRAVLLFVLGYVLVTILAIALAMSVEVIMHPNHTGPMVQNPAYIFSQRFYPLINLLVWIAISWIYFKAPKGSDPRTEAWWLGSVWLVLALIVDLVGFVIIENPISLSPYDFYVGQFPWIYLIYLAILLSPILYVKIGSPKPIGQGNGS